MLKSSYYFQKILIFIIFSFFMTHFAFANDDGEANTSQNLPFLPQTSFNWYYSSQNEPIDINSEEIIGAIIKAASVWRACGIEMNFKGTVQSPPNKHDKLNMIGWGNLPLGIRAITFRDVNKESAAISESDIFINFNAKKLRSDKKLFAKVVAHEFGHAIGLFHSKGCEDVMSSAKDCGPLIPDPPPQNPTKNDLEQCSLRYKHN